MLEKTITYTDYEGFETTETFWFNLSQTELFRLNIGEVGGLEGFIARASASRDAATLFAKIEEIVLTAYGERDPDGKHFRKSPELSKAFSQTPAYDVLMMELVTVPDATAAFMMGCLPPEMSRTIAANPEYQAKLEELKNKRNAA